MHFATTMLMLPAMALALKVTQPSKDSTWDSSKGQKVEFEAVSTDPKSVNIVLVNMASYPPVSVTIAENVASSSGSYEIPSDKLASLGTDDGYQINLVNPDNDGILAQSGTFEVEKSDSAATTSSGSSASTTGTATATGTQSQTTITGSRTTTLAVSTTGTSTESSTNTANASTTSSTANASTTPNAAAINNLGKGGLVAAIFAGLAALL